ncbi:hypothetical protein ACOT81_06630 [Streptomyces sp. WI04-05B]|uniref:hypothetical protein n=1 Tax=Streptomyces TaxID=1883 RepID=UPI0029B17914|nr:MULTISPECIES: hypothetical protein [unclassified Streptomyces]MDX2544989.1 hypothetical protein [Streptomyces sp. WI04-05B]MDX2587480.1 hypothetical protein [Streptomyces sp. WI04-05A]
MSGYLGAMSESLLHDEMASRERSAARRAAELRAGGSRPAEQIVDLLSVEVDAAEVEFRRLESSG